MRGRREINAAHSKGGKDGCQQRQRQYSVVIAHHKSREVINVSGLPVLELVAGHARGDFPYAFFRRFWCFVNSPRPLNLNWLLHSSKMIKCGTTYIWFAFGARRCSQREKVLASLQPFLDPAVAVWVTSPWPPVPLLRVSPGRPFGGPCGRPFRPPPNSPCGWMMITAAVKMKGRWPLSPGSPAPQNSALPARQTEGTQGTRACQPRRLCAQAAEPVSWGMVKGLKVEMSGRTMCLGVGYPMHPFIHAFPVVWFCLLLNNCRLRLTRCHQTRCRCRMTTSKWSRSFQLSWIYSLHRERHDLQHHLCARSGWLMWEADPKMPEQSRNCGCRQRWSLPNGPQWKLKLSLQSGGRACGWRRRSSLRNACCECAANWGFVLPARDIPCILSHQIEAVCVASCRLAPATWISAMCLETIHAACMLLNFVNSAVCSPPSLSPFFVLLLAYHDEKSHQQCWQPLFSWIFYIFSAILSPSLEAHFPGSNEKSFPPSLPPLAGRGLETVPVGKPLLNCWAFQRLHWRQQPIWLGLRVGMLRTWIDTV